MQKKRRGLGTKPTCARLYPRAMLHHDVAVNHSRDYSRFIQETARWQVRSRFDLVSTRFTNDGEPSESVPCSSGSDISRSPSLEETETSEAPKVTAENSVHPDEEVIKICRLLQA